MKHVKSISPASIEPAGAERRIDPRKVMRVRARVSVEGDAPLDAQTVDLSLNGVSITSTQQVNVGAQCSVELGVSVPEIGSPPVLRTVVRYCGRMSEGRFRVGMQFIAVSAEAAKLLTAVLA
jgi:hypothetical protein